MHTRLLSLVAALLSACLMASAQGTQTIQSLRLVNPSGPTAGITLVPPTGITSYSLTLPSAQGSNGQVLVNNGSGTLSWGSPSSTSWSLTGNDVTSSGGALGAAPTGSFLGTTSSSTVKDLRIATNSVVRMIVASDGAITMGGTLGVTGATTLSSTLGVTGLITGNAGATLTGGATSISGGTVSLNANSNNTTNINTGTSTGAVTIGNTGSTVTIGSIATTLKSSVGSNDRIIVASSTGTLDQASISSVVALGVASSAWSMAGNSSTDSTTTFLGTTDETTGRPIVFKTDGTERMRVTGGNGYIGIGTSVPDVSLEVNGGLVLSSTTASVSPTELTITVGNRAFIVVQCNGTPAQRTVTLTNGVADGQRLTILVKSANGNPNEGMTMNAADANLKLSSSLGLEDGDVIELVYYSGIWYEISRSTNGDI